MIMQKLNFNSCTLIFSSAFGSLLSNCFKIYISCPAIGFFDHKKMLRKSSTNAWLFSLSEIEEDVLFCSQRHACISLCEVEGRINISIPHYVSICQMVLLYQYCRQPFYWLMIHLLSVHDYVMCLLNINRPSPSFLKVM